MSSILKALKKLESEKSQRDELSTAVASDILRSSRSKRVRSVSLVVFIAVTLLLVVASVAYYVAVQVQVVKNDPPPLAVTLPPTVPPVANQGKSDTVESAQVLPVPTNLPALSGIVYQEDAANRLAIINDLPVMEGTLVEGFTVKSIHPHKVVVSRMGIDYDLLLRDD